MVPATILLLAPAASPGMGAGAGYAFVLAFMVLSGLLNGPLDIALFTVRQRRTDPAWLGRAFAVSMAINFAGFPVGAAIAGTVAETSIGLAVALGVGACAVSTLFAAFLVPREEHATAPPLATAPAPARVAEGDTTSASLPPGEATLGR
jgi:hypothetical protein